LSLAHFTATELPGTLAVWVAGIGLGLALGTGTARAAAWPLVVMASLAVLGMLGDTYGWAPAVKIALDSVFLLAAAVLAATFWRGLRSRA
jgi:hypothetical protein